MRSASISVNQARIWMAMQANDPNFDKTEWDVEAWQERLVTLGVEPIVYPDPNLGDPIPEDEAEDAEDAGEAAVEKGGREGS